MYKKISNRKTQIAKPNFKSFYLKIQQKANEI